MKRDAAWLKSQRIQDIHKMLQGAEEPKRSQLSRVLALCEYRFGISQKTARQYLKVLEDLGFIEVDEFEDFIQEIKKE